MPTDEKKNVAECPPGWLTFYRDDELLAARDFGGNGPPALLLHGLAGHAEEWNETAAWMRRGRRVVALDLRGHGRSERAPSDVSLDSLITDISFVIEEIGPDPVLLLGQSLGGLVAFQVAARHPQLVASLIVAEAGPAGAGEAGADEKAAEVETSLGRWPVPFSSLGAAESFFGGPSLHATAWASGLEPRDDGWYPRFDIPTLGRMLRESIGVDCWDTWSRLRCPTLIVRGSRGSLSEAEAQRMETEVQVARVVALHGAGHELHLDAPDEWRAAIEDFVENQPAPS